MKMQDKSSHRIAFYSLGDEASSYYRTYLPAAELVRRGFDVTIIRDIENSTLRDFDTVVVHRLFSEDSYHLLLDAPPRIRVVLDVDENFHRKRPPKPEEDEDLKNVTRLRRFGAEIVELSDELIVANASLGDYYRPYNDALTLIPDMMPSESSSGPGLGVASREGILVGCHRGGLEDDDLGILAEVVPAIKGKYPKTSFLILGDPPARDIPGLDFIKAPSYDRILWALSKLRLDIGLAPLSDTLYNRSRTGRAWLEMAAGRVPVIGSDLPPYEGLIDPGVNGLLAAFAEDWIDAISQLIEKPERRASLGAAAHKAAADRFDHKLVGDMYAALAARWSAS